MKLWYRIGFTLVIALLVPVVAMAAGADESEGAAGGGDVEVTDPGELPIVTEPTTVTYLESYWPQGTVDESAGHAFVQQVTGVDIEYVWVARDTRNEKFQLMAQSGSLPDIIGTLGGLANFNQVYTYGQQGVFLDLRDLYEEHGYWSKIAYTELAPEVLDLLITPDGGMYALANYLNRQEAEVRQAFFMEQNFLDNVGMDVPTTTEEMFDVLMAFKTQDANGNGDPDDEIPFTTLVSQWNTSVETSIFMTAFTHVTAGDYRAMDGQGNVIYSPATEGYREGLAYIHRLYEAGLIYPESFTQDRPTQQALNESNEGYNVIGSNLGPHRGWNNTGWRDPSPDARWRDYVIVPPLAGPDGVRTAARASITRGIQPGAAISADAENPAVAFRLLDYMMSEEGALLQEYGVEGIGWRRANEDEVTVAGEPAYLVNLRDTYEEDAICVWQDAEYNCDQLGQGWPRAVTDNLLRVAVDDVSDPLLDWQYYHGQFRDIYYPYFRDRSYYWPTYLYTDSSITNELALLQTTLDEFVKTAVVEFVTGQRDIEEGWDDFLNELDRFGLDRYLELSQQTYDENVGSGR